MKHISGRNPNGINRTEGLGNVEREGLSTPLPKLTGTYT